MTHEEFISLLKQPELVEANHEFELKQLVELYPAFIHVRFLYLKALQLSKSVNFGANNKLAPLYSFDKHWLFYFLYPENRLSNEVLKRENVSKSSGDYFDMIEKVEKAGGDSKQSLKNLAEKLKSARSLVVGNLEPKVQIEIESVGFQTIENQHDIVDSRKSTDYFEFVKQPDVSISDVKILVTDKKYQEAIEILRKLNLNNPKKSVYFADQIRFLERIIANSKK